MRRYTRKAGKRAMSKGKKARFRVKSDEKILKSGMMDYCITGGYGHVAQGDAILTDERFFFGADIGHGEYLSFEIPLKDVYDVQKTGVPFFTRSMLLMTDGNRYRLNAFMVGRWVKAVRRAIDGARKKN